MDLHTSEFLQKLSIRMIWILDKSNMTKHEFGYKFNNEKEHKGINRYFSGINMSFKTLLKISYSFQLNLSFILDLDNFDEGFSKYKDNLNFNFLDFTENLRNFREIKGKTQLDLDVYTNIDRSNISNYENRKVNPRLDKIVKIANQLNVEPFELFLKMEKI